MAENNKKQKADAAELAEPKVILKIFYINIQYSH
jgi:hypothetical protein